MNLFSLCMIALILSTVSSWDHRKLAAVPVLPDLKHQSKEEANYLKLHKCKDSGEVYSASYFITKEHILYQKTAYNLSMVNCEMGSFIMMNGRADPHKNVNGTLIQALDVLDCSVIHLSAYERLQRRWAKSISIFKKSNPNKIKEDQNDTIFRTTDYLMKAAQAPSSWLSIVPELNRTVAIMPFLASDMGAGHSKLSNRLLYIQACFWSVYAMIPHVVAAVKNVKDYEFAKSILPFYEVMLIEDLPKSASLPVATVQQAKARLQDGRWDFDYVYFTESDQILLLRIARDVYDHLKQFPRRLVVPHRLMPYPKEIVSVHHQREVSNASALDWTAMKCCMPRQNCYDRKTWISIKNTSVPIVQIYGLQVPLGNTNFHEETFRHCTMLPNQEPSAVCP